MGALTLLITGAGGYVGRYTVAAARAHDHRVIAVLRRADQAPVAWAGDPLIEVLEWDLTEPGVLPAVDAVVHIAASLSGDDTVQAYDTIAATRNVLQAIHESGQSPTLVLASSISVYSGTDLTEGDTVTEASPIERQSALRDAYCRAKIEQERLCLEAVVATGLALHILRIGAVFGPGRVWNAHVGVGFGPVLLRFGQEGQIPLAHVRHVAQVLVLATETPAVDADECVINVVDDDLPNRGEFVKALAKGGWPRVVLPLSWRVFALAAGKRPGLPGLLRLPTLRARMMPVKYNNARLHARLGWHPEAGFKVLMRDALAAEARDV